MQKNLVINCTVEGCWKIQLEQYYAGVIVSGSEYIIVKFNQSRFRAMIRDFKIQRSDGNENVA